MAYNDQFWANYNKTIKQTQKGSPQRMALQNYAAILQPAQEMFSYYTPGGGYGQGQRQEAAETVKGGLGTDIGSMVASGMSGQFGARGAGTRAGSELSKLYKNIEDTRNQLWQQSFAPYAEMMKNMNSIMQGATPQWGSTSPEQEKQSAWQNLYAGTPGASFYNNSWHF